MQTMQIADGLMGVFMGSAMLFIIASMIIIMIGLSHRHISQKRKKYITRLRRHGRSWISNVVTDTESVIRVALTRQASLYILSTIITWIFPIIRFFHQTEQGSISILTLVFWPLQGFFNASIFIYHKVYNIKKTDCSISTGKALYFVFVSPQKVPELELEGLSIVDFFHEARLKDKYKDNNKEEEQIENHNTDSRCVAAASNNVFSISMPETNNVRSINNLSKNSIDDVSGANFEIDHESKEEITANHSNSLLLHNL